MLEITAANEDLARYIDGRISSEPRLLQNVRKNATLKEAVVTSGMGRACLNYTSTPYRSNGCREMFSKHWIAYHKIWTRPILKPCSKSKNQELREERSTPRGTCSSLGMLCR